MIICIIGNDNRQQELARLFNKHYDTIYLSGKEDSKTAQNVIKICDKIVLPLPVTRDNETINTTSLLIDDFMNACPKNATVFAGMTKNTPFNNDVIDYNKDEDFTLKNALYTAEGAMAIAINNTMFSLSDAKILILGNGRIGKYLSKMLSSLCSDITISARKQKDFCYILQNGFKTENTEKIKDLSSYNIIFNTINEKVITDEAICTIKKDSLIIDLASKKSALFRADARYIDAKALPAEFSPLSSAKALYDSVTRYL